jgi:RNA polymerase sigma-70 factor (ECF subfamily)
MTPGTTDDQDRADMIRLSAGHDAALNDLMDRYGQKLFHYLVRALQSEDDAADLAQETFCRIYQSRAKYDPKQKFSAWLYAIATNLVKDRYRYRTRHPQVSLDAENAETETSLQERLPDHHSSPSETLVSVERADTVRRAVAALPEELRLPLILAEYEAQSHAEIGQVLGCTAKAVETRIYRARLQLRQTLAPLMQNA